MCEPLQTVALLATTVGSRHEQHVGEQAVFAPVAGLVDDKGIGEVVHIVFWTAADGKGKIRLEVAQVLGLGGMADDGAIGQQR